jgi:hypothetical protein
MRYPAEIPGCTALVELEAGGFVTGPKLFVNDAPARQGLKKGEYLLPGNDGAELVAKLRPQFIDPIPALEVNGQLIRFAPAFTWEWIFVVLPFLLVVGGGCVGGLIGGVGAWANATLLRSELPTGAKAAIAALITVATLGGGFVILGALQLSIGGLRNR